jgi:hypothetical protein
MAVVLFSGEFILFDRVFRAAAGALLLLPGLLVASAQSHPASGHETHHYDLRDSALARAAQRYDWAQEGKGNRAELEKLVADNYELVRASGKVTDKAGLIDLICHPGSYTNPYTVEAPFVRDMGDAVILGGWVRITGTDGGKPFEQKARFADIWHKGEKGWQLTYTQVTLADHP